MHSICDWAMEGGGGWAGKLVAVFYCPVFIIHTKSDWPMGNFNSWSVIPVHLGNTINSI